MEKIGVSKIEITRAEGLIEECGKTHTVSTFQEANSVLKIMARSAPKDGGYDKTDFKVTWNDGETYEGRYDLTHEDTISASLQGHMVSFCQTISGRVMPVWMNNYPNGLEMWKRSKKQNAKHAEEYGKLLDLYQLD